MKPFSKHCKSRAAGHTRFLAGLAEGGQKDRLIYVAHIPPIEISLI